MLSEQNEIRFDYSTGNFEYINEADVYADYSSLIISKANYIDLKADYSKKTKINYIENFDFNCDFGAINIDHVNTINGNGIMFLLDQNTYINLVDLNPILDP